MIPSSRVSAVPITTSVNSAPDSARCPGVWLASYVIVAHGNIKRDDCHRQAVKPRGPPVSKADRTNSVPSTLTTIPLVDPHARSTDPSIGDLIKDATTQMSTLVRAEVE